ncbi:major facilitator superfamily domain-containing protein [Pisolithus marmoratus]|nr:major facilitator superfamily domain-containing protein [Pisolithus marmoratus]
MASLLDSQYKIPKLLGVRRIVTLLGALLVALSCGTNYIFSAYAPQLGARLHVSHTQLNIVGLAGNVGDSVSGPVWGRIVDSRGPRILLAGAFVCSIVGYSGIKRMYGDGTGSGTSISSVHFALLITCSLLTGLGANAGVTAAVNTVAKSFPESARATTTALVLSSLGLSAFCFSIIAQIFFPGDTSALLLLLSLATSIPPLLAVFIVRPIPLPPTRPGPEGDQTGHYERIPNAEVVPFIADCSASVEEDDRRTLLVNSQSGIESSSALEIGYAEGPLRPDTLLDIHGTMLFRTLDFYLLFMITLLLAGTGIMCEFAIDALQSPSTFDADINSVGAISRALIAESNPKYDETEASKQQVAQVSTLSIGNFAGRILIGLISDFSHSYFRLPRGYYLCFVSILFILSQTFAIGVSDISTLRMATAILGLAYGSLIGILPVITIDWFGLAHLSENLGYVCLALLVGGNVFSIIFGRNLDAHVSREDTNTLLGVTRTTNAASVAAMRDILSERQCLLGRECYVSSLKVTLVACVAALALSTWAALRDEHRKRLRKGMVDGYDESVGI